MAKVTAMVAASGRPYVTASADQNRIANDKMLEFAERTRCLYDDAVPFTLVQDQGVYNTRGSAFTKDLCHIDFVYIDGVPLRNYQGHKGLVGLGELQAYEHAYLAAESGRPVRAALINPTSLRIWPNPDVVYSDCYAAGYTLPAAIDTAAGGDNTPIEFNDEDADALAAFIGVGLVEWTAVSESDYERMAYFDRKAAARMKAMSEKMESQQRGPMVRGIGGSGRAVAELG
jgi:hypothetical protein